MRHHLPLRPILLLTLLGLGAGGLVGCGASVVGRAVDPVSPTLRARTSFDDVDGDRDSQLSESEFAGAIAFFYADFDHDEDASLTESEFADGMFRAFDVDGSGRVERGELERGAMTWWPARTRASLDRWDTDLSGGLDRAEMAEGMARARIFAAFDADRDGRVSDAEVARTVFGSWDLDSNASLDALEWRW